MDKYSIRSDLMIEAIDLSKENEGIISEVKKVNNIKTTIVDITTDNAVKKKGKYITIEFNDLIEEKNDIKNEFQNSLKLLFKINNINDKSSCLIIGLGNDKSTADSLGPSVVDNIIVTRHLDLLGLNTSRIVSAIKPGVTGETGIETKDIIVGIFSKVKPDFLIVVDSLASTSISRINKTIQMTDTGIHPGSGVGNKREEISKDTLNVPVIAIGVPTVCDAVTIVNDTIEGLHKHFAITTENINNPKFKLIPTSSINELPNDSPLSKEEITELSGIIGSLDEDKRKQLMYEVLDKTEYNLMVTPKEIDFLIDKLSDLISICINEGIHNFKL